MKPKEIFDQVRKEKRKNLTELESREVLKHYKIPLVKGEVVHTIEKSIKFAEKNGYPVALKIISPDIIHKTDVGGVILNINSKRGIHDSFYKMIKNIKKKKPRAEIEGIFIQKMITEGHEVFVGGKWDQTFHQTIVFGLGGIFVEVFEDVSFRIVPITKKDALEMIQEIKAYDILKGYRGKPASINSLVDILMKTSKMLEQNPEIKELDINPIFALPKSAIPVDARIIID